MQCSHTQSVYLYNLRRTRKFLSQGTCERLVHAPISCRIDYNLQSVYFELQQFVTPAVNVLISLIKFSVYKTRRNVLFSDLQSSAILIRHFLACTRCLSDIELTVRFAS